MNRKLNKKTKDKCIVGLKRAIPLSEEDLSDRRSSSSNDSMDKQKQISDSKCQRGSRRASQKRSRCNFDYIDNRFSGTDEDWNEKGFPEEDSNDSDPAWCPAEKDATSLAPPKVKGIVAKVKKISPVPPCTIKADPVKATDETDDPLLLKPLGALANVESSLSFAGLVPRHPDDHDKGFESGKFIMLKSDLKTQKSPCIWRIDGKNLLQKYELVSVGDGNAYRNISTYSSWMAVNKCLYVPIDVKFSVQSKSETIVTFDRTKVMLPLENELFESMNDEGTALVDTFQVYLQTLISQALDSNFLKEIVKENDEYFLTSIDVVEAQWIAPRRNELKEIVRMKKSFQELLDVHPELELQCVTSGDKSCDTCGGRNPTRSFEFLPHTYNFDTLDTLEGKVSSKSYRLCLSCTERVLLYHQLFHIRYHLFICCQSKIKEYDHEDGPAALTACLADQQWKSSMHRTVLLLLAEAQQVINHSSEAST